MRYLAFVFFTSMGAALSSPGIVYCLWVGVEILARDALGQSFDDYFWGAVGHAILAGLAVAFVKGAYELRQDLFGAGAPDDRA